ncbi:putative amino acid transporter [Aeropyrum pernix K1]|uniref:Amino acid transporter n=1 Tax=Aeropyrum pernix (strain ATCC 700893 / DSM 11879 / JCM 9820 / NBRC 100138 / K1) TaxID=272557 RepID=Q9YG91_AERPE|nr:amino acid permease [Aeropyrum pernix]BAA78919.2 putative amino acid transporter [Aeropyrum pernix K1]
MSARKGTEKLGFWEVFSIGVGGMIGGGIFATLGLSLELAGAAAPLAFLLAGSVALITSYSYAKLSSRYPSEGGTIEFIVRAYGDNVISGGLNIMLLASYIVMISLYAHAFGSYGASMINCCPREAYIALVVFVIAGLTVVNMLGAIMSGRVELGLVIFKLLVLILVAVVSMPLVDWNRLGVREWPSILSIVAGGMIIFLAYEGFELVANTAKDVRDTTTLRKGLYASVVTVIIVYVLIAIVAAGTLDPDTVRIARDYALAVLVEPVLGKIGFTLVVAAALASTSSAINATLYGSARVSYIIAKYGEAPQLLGRHIWRGAYEGLLVISILGLLLALYASLEQISTAGSGGFLIIFAAVNLAAYKLRRETGANPLISLVGFILNLTSLAILVYQMASMNPGELAILAVLIAGSMAAEALYRRIKGRRLPQVIDPSLKVRESLISGWRNLTARAAEIIKREIMNAEVYITGSIARGEYEKSGDIDLIVSTTKPLSPHEVKFIEERLVKELNLPPSHPLHIHTVTRDKLENFKHKVKID